MNKKNGIWLWFAVWTLVSCGTVKSTREKPAVALAQSSLTPEQQRKYDYFFLEAMRLKKEGLCVRFRLLQHCLDIHPNAASALYEGFRSIICSFVRCRKGQEALERLWRMRRITTGIVGDWHLCISNRTNWIRLSPCWNRWWYVFLPSRTRFSTFWTCMADKEKYDEVISTLNRLEKRMGRMNSCPWRSFRIYLQMKDDKKAFQEIESLVQEYPMDMRYQVILGTYIFRMVRNRRLMTFIKKVLAAEPDNPMAIFSMASYYKQTGQEELYQQQLDTLLLNKKVTPDTKVGVMRQMIVENEQADKDSTQIIALFDRIMKQEQDDPQIPMLYAQYLLSRIWSRSQSPSWNRWLTWTLPIKLPV